MCVEAIYTCFPPQSKWVRPVVHAMLYRGAEETLPETKLHEQRSLLGFSDIQTISNSGHYLAVSGHSCRWFVCFVPCCTDSLTVSKEDLLLTQLCHWAGGKNMGGAQYCNERLEGLLAQLSLILMQRFWSHNLQFLQHSWSQMKLLLFSSNV